MMTSRSGLPLGSKLTGQQLNHFVVFNCLLLLAILPVRILEWFCHEFCMRARRAVQQFPYICFLVRVQKLKKQGYSNQNQNGEILVCSYYYVLIYYTFIHVEVCRRQQSNRWTAPSSQHHQMLYVAASIDTNRQHFDLLAALAQPLCLPLRAHCPRTLA